MAASEKWAGVGAGLLVYATGRGRELGKVKASIMQLAAGCMGQDNHDCQQRKCHSRLAAALRDIYEFLNGTY